MPKNKYEEEPLMTEEKKAAEAKPAKAPKLADPHLRNVIKIILKR